MSAVARLDVQDYPVDKAHRHEITTLVPTASAGVRVPV
jgi:hypothetical protein